jgi:hypothetical protein
MKKLIQYFGRRLEAAQGSSGASKSLIESGLTGCLDQMLFGGYFEILTINIEVTAAVKPFSRI